MGEKFQEFEYSQRRAVESVPVEQLPHKLPNASPSNEDTCGADRVLPSDQLNTEKETRPRFIGRMFWGFGDDQVRR